MTVIVNGRFLLHKITGVERYAHEILAELDKLVSPGEVVLAVPPDVKDVPDYRNIKIKRIGKLKNRLWEHISLPRFVQKSHGIVLNLCNTASLFKPGIVIPSFSVGNSGCGIKYCSEMRLPKQRR